MNNTDAVKKLRAVFKAVTDEAAQNEEFAAKLAKAIGLDDGKKAKPAAKSKRNPAVLNPVKMIAEDAAALEQRLTELSDAELKDIIAEYALDPARVSGRWRNKERLVAFIMDMAHKWAVKGDVFR